MAKYVILIAGNICAGKTKFVNYVKQQDSRFQEFLSGEEELKIVPESIDPVGLENFYHDRKAHTSQFEMTCLHGRINRHQKAKRSNDIYIFDRGMIEGAETFCKNSFLEGYLSHEDYELYVHTVKKALDKLDRTEQQQWLEQLVVYFRMDDLLNLHQRQRGRKTGGEVIPVAYLQRIHECYEEFFHNIKEVYARYGIRHPRVLTIDAAVDFHQDKDYHHRTLEQVLQTLHDDRTQK